MTIRPNEIPKLRGFLANEYKEYELLHNHLPGGKFNFKFPKIQYRIINSHPALIAVKEGVDVILDIFLGVNKIKLEDKVFIVNEREIYVKKYDFGQAEQYFTYKFLTPWMALNEINYRKYIKMGEPEKQTFLKSILRGNLLTLAKGFDYTIPDFENIKVEGFFTPMKVNFKNLRMICFKGEFMTNFHIPNYLGLGKQSARGFGTVKRVR
jgi:hypothetical protein